MFLLAFSPLSKFTLALALISPFILAARPLLAQENQWDKHMKAAEKAYASHKLQNADKEFKAALAETRNFPVNDMRTAETLSKFASLNVIRERYADAEVLSRQAMTIVEASAGPDDPRLGYVLIGLAMAYECEDKHDTAAAIWNRSLAVLEKGKVPADPTVLSAMNTVANRIFMKSSFAAENIVQSILELGEYKIASDLDVRTALRTLAQIYRYVHRDSEVESLEARILEIDKKVFGPDSLETAREEGVLGDIYERDGEYGAAVPLLRHELEINEKLSARPGDSATKRILKKTGEGVDAVEIISGMFFLGQAVISLPPIIPLGTGDLASFNVQYEYKNLASVCVEAGKYSDAEELYTKHIIPMDEPAAAKRAPDRVDLANDFKDLSRVYRHERRYDEALDALKRSEALFKSAVEPKYMSAEDTSIWLWSRKSDLAEIEREKGDLATAEPLFERCLEVLNPHSRGPAYLDIAEMLTGYATLLRDEGKYDEAEALYKRSLDFRAKSKTDRQPGQLEQAEALSGYALLLRKLDRPAEAEPMEAQALAIREKIGAPSPVN